MKGKMWKKSSKEPKRPDERWYFNTTPNSLEDMFNRFRFLLDHIPMILPPYRAHSSEEKSRWESYSRPLNDLSCGGCRKTVWDKFHDDTEQRFGRIANDSMSTLATIDDNPGTGRCVDKFLYQPIGQSIERLFLRLELRYFSPPEKNARQIIRFLETSAYSGNYIPVNKICEHSFCQGHGYEEDEDFEMSLMCLFMEIRREQEIAKAFTRLLTQASSKQRSMRVEAQKLLWSLFRYKNIFFILHVITNLEDLLWDGYTTFQHCSPLDPDFQTHFCLRWDMEETAGNSITVDIGYNAELLGTPLRDILETCARENRGFSTLQINLVYEHLNHYLMSCGIEEVADDLYLAIIAIAGFSIEFPYVLSVLEELKYSIRSYGNLKTLMELPDCFEGQGRTESNAKTFELMVHFIMSWCIMDPDATHVFALDLAYFSTLLIGSEESEYKMSELEARASEDYLLKVNEILAKRGPITFALFKDIMSKPLSWERYRRSEVECEREGRGKARAPSTWHYELFVSQDIFPNTSIFFYYYIPFSDDNFKHIEFYELLCFIDGEPRISFRGPETTWIRIQRWIMALKNNSMTLPGNRPGTDLYRVLKWWRNFNHYPAPSQSKKSKIRLARLLNRYLSRTEISSEILVAGLSTTCDPDTNARLSSPFTFRVHKQSLRVSLTDRDIHPQTWVKSEPAEPPTLFQIQCRFNERLTLKIEEEESYPIINDDLARKIVPLPRRYRTSSIAKEHKADKQNSLQSVKKRQEVRNHLKIPDSNSDSSATKSKDEFVSFRDHGRSPTPFRYQFRFNEQPTLKVEVDKPYPEITDNVARKIVPLTSSGTEEEHEADEESSLQSLKKTQEARDHFSIRDSSSDSSVIEAKDESTDTESEDSLTVDEDFWSAKSIAELSMLSID